MPRARLTAEMREVQRTVTAALQAANHNRDNQTKYMACINYAAKKNDIARELAAARDAN